MDGSEESNKSFRLMQMSGNSTHQVTNVWIRTNSTVSGMYVQRICYYRRYKIYFCGHGNWQRPRLINIFHNISLSQRFLRQKCNVPVGKAIDALLVIFFVTRENEKKLKKSV